MGHNYTAKSNNNSPFGVRYRNSRWRVITAVSMAPVMFFAFFYCFTHLSGEAMAADVSFTVNNNDTVLELTVPSSVSLNLTPTNGTAFGIADLNIGVGTNNPVGYTLKMTASSATLTRTGTTTDGNGNTITPTIATITGNYDESAFRSSNDTINKWGYKLSTASSYGAMDTNIHTLKTTEGPSNATSTDVVLNFAAKVDTTQPAGTYQTTLNFEAVTNVPPKTYMQDLTTTTIATLLPNIGNTATVYDIRDESEYLIGKLADGNYWMLDNLRLDLTNSTIRNGLTTSNTNVDSASLTSLLSGNRANGAQYASSGFATWDSNNNSNVYNQAKVNADYKNTVASVTYGDGSGKIGVYYNYCAASAGSYCYESSSSTGNAQYDICPHGWRMPTGGTSGEYRALYTAYSSNVSNFQAALSTPLSGDFVSGSAGDQGSLGFFWSSTRTDDNYSMYNLYVNSTSVYPQASTSRSSGFSVRCVFDDTIMQ